MGATRMPEPAPSPARALGELLRARREALQPADVGLAPGARRRTRGLRREEVAGLAAISTTYLTFLEQGREVRPSRAVLDALAGALRLTAAEREYVRALVHGRDAAPPGDASPEEVLPGIAALVQRLDPHPTYVTGRCWDVLASNRAARALWTDWDARGPDERNLLLWMVADPAARRVFAEWEPETRAQLARFRAAAVRHPGDPRVAALVERLHAASGEVAGWWAAHDVAPLGSGSKRLRHPELGELELHHVVLQVADDPDQKLVTFRPSPRDEARIAALLAA